MSIGNPSASWADESSNIFRYRLHGNEGHVKRSSGCKHSQHRQHGIDRGFERNVFSWKPRGLWSLCGKSSTHKSQPNIVSEENPSCQQDSVGPSFSGTSRVAELNLNRDTIRSLSYRSGCIGAVSHSVAVDLFEWTAFAIWNLQENPAFLCKVFNSS